jgi:hypothetical protein
MATRQLARFSISEIDEGYLLRLEDDDGAAVEMVATDEQIDSILEELDRVLGEDDDYLDGEDLDDDDEDDES